MLGLFNKFGEVSVELTTSGTIGTPIFDVIRDGKLNREIYSEHDLSFFENYSLTRDKVAFFLGSFPGNVIGKTVKSMKHQTDSLGEILKGFGDRVNKINLNDIPVPESEQQLIKNVITYFIKLNQNGEGQSLNLGDSTKERLNHLIAHYKISSITNISKNEKGDYVVSFESGEYEIIDFKSMFQITLLYRGAHRS